MRFLAVAIILLLLGLPTQTRADDSCCELAKQFSIDPNSLDINDLAKLKTCINNKIRTRLYGTGTVNPSSAAAVCEPKPIPKPAVPVGPPPVRQ